jgi:hypothetical protein
MKRNYFFIIFFLISVASFAQEAPMRGWRFNSFSVTLNGRWFGEYQYAESWREQDGYAIVLGERRRYWLYDTYSYRNGIADELYDRVIPEWVEGMGYAIDFDNIQVFFPNTDLASSVKALMTQRSCDISVTLLNEPSARYNAVYINNFNRDTGIYDTIVYPLRK